MLSPTPATLLALLYTLALSPLASCLTLPELRHRSIYQVFTDRFARSDGQMTYCNPSDKDYCGGTWKGIERNLEYIQRMGFDTSEFWKCWLNQAKGSMDLARCC